MSTVAGAAVVVGVDGSPRGTAAVEVAATTAARRRRRLRIIHVLTWPRLPVLLPPGVVESPPEALQHLACAYLAEAIAIARKAAPDVAADAELVNGRPAHALADESRHADLLVVGERGTSGLLLGSVTTYLASHAFCPVLVVRGEPRTTGPVVVGIDGSAESTRALTFALEEASLRDTALVALHAWRGSDWTELDRNHVTTDESWTGDAQERRVLAEAVAGAGARYPDVPIRRQVVHGNAGSLLGEWSHSAQLIVVGDRGHSGLMLGSVSQHLVHHADCPTTVVRARPPAH